MKGSGRLARNQVFCVLLLGALLYGGCGAYSWLSTDLGYMGYGRETAATMLVDHYLREYLLFNLKLLGLTCLLGSAVAFLAAIAAVGWGRSVSGIGFWLRWTFAVMVVTLLVLLRAVLLHPQLFWGLYAEPGWWRWAIDFILDNIRLDAVEMALVVCTFLVFLGVLRTWGWRIAGYGVLIGVLIGVWTVRPVSLPSPEPGMPNVLLVIIDSLRTDRISSLGYPRQTTEHLDKILGCSTGFPNTYVSLPRTTPSVVSLMTGRLPYEHGIRTMFPSSAERQLKRDSLPMLLAENGYKTAVVSDYAGEMFHDVDLGFDIVKAPSFNFPAIFRQRSLESQYLLLVWLNNALGRRLLPELVLLPQNANPEVLTDQALEMISSLPQPFFTTVFYSATHFPYTANYPDYSYFSNKSYRGAFRFSAPYVLDAKHLPGPEEQAQVSALYDGALLGVDRALGRLVDNFRQSGLLNNTIIVVTGDHGENLYEQGSGLGHGDHFVAGLQSLRTPTVVSVPGCQEKGLVQKDVRSIDLPRTIAGLLGYSEDADQRFGGRSFYAEDPVPRPVYAETGLWMSSVSTSPIAQQRIDYPDILQTAEIDFEFGDEVVLKQKYQNLVNISKHRLYKEGPWVLLYKPTRSGVRYELYDYGNDPHLTRDLSQDNTERTDRMRTRLLALMAAEPGVAIKNDFVVYENL